MAAEWSRRQIVRASVVGTSAIGLAGCTGNQDEETTPGGDGMETETTADTTTDSSGGEEGGSGKTTLRISTPAEQPSLDPAHAGLSQQNEWMFSPFNALLRVEWNYDDNTWSYVPDLAEDYEIQDENDGTVAQFTLRDDVTYHNGDDLTADLVKQEIDYWFDVAASAASGVSFISETSVDDDLTLNLHMESSAATLPLEISSVPIPHPGIREERGESAFASDISGGGTGPYQFVEYNTGSEIRFESYDDYHVDGVPNFEELVVKVIPEPSTRVAQLRSGDLDLDNWISPENLRSLEGTDGLVTRNEPAVFYGSALFNLNHEEAEPLLDKRVRRALIQGIDSKEFGQAMFRGFDSAVSQPTLPGSWWHHQDLHDRNLYDPENARQLLADAGYPDGFTITSLTGSDSFYRRMGTVVQSMWSEIGVDLELEPMEYGSMWSSIYAGEHVIAISRTVGPPDPDHFIRRYIFPGDEPGGLGIIRGWEHDEYFDLARQQFQTSDQAEREELVRQAFEIWAEEMPSLFFSETHNLVAYDERLQDYWLWPGDTSREAIRDLSWSE